MLIYFGPETLAPAASVIAGAAGLALLFGRRVIGSLRAARDRLLRPLRRSTARRRRGGERAGR